MANELGLLLEDFNLLHVLVAALLAFVIGSIWFAPPLFGRKWRALVQAYTKMTDEELRGGIVRALGMWFGTSVLNALILSLILGLVGATSVIDAILTGVLVWAGFGLTFSSWSVIFGRQPAGVLWINNGAYLIMQIAMSILLTVWN